MLQPDQSLLFSGVALGSCCPTSQIKYLLAVWFSSIPYSPFYVGSPKPCLEGTLSDLLLKWAFGHSPFYAQIVLVCWVASCGLNCLLPPSQYIKTLDRMGHFLVLRIWTGSLSRFIVLGNVPSGPRF